MLKKYVTLFLLVWSALSAGAQTDTKLKTRDSLPYQKYPSLPAFNVLLQDSATIFNTYYVPEGKPTVIIFFSPDCDHCQRVTKDVMEKIDSLQDAHLLFLTPMPLATLRPFATQMKLNEHRNITVGKDYQYFFFNFYGAKFVPYIAVYDRKKKFVKMWEGSLNIEDLLEVLAKL